MKINLVTWAIYVTSIKCAVCLNILGIFPHEGKSHLKVFAPVMKKLLERGHRVTLITRFSIDTPSDNLEEILLDGKLKGEHDYSMETFDLPGPVLALGSAVRLTKFGITGCHSMYSNPQVQKLVSSNPKFDLIIAELFNSECHLSFVHKFHAPLVGLSSTRIMPWHSARLGQPNNPSYISNNHLWYEGKTEFFYRLNNLLLNLWYDLVHLYQVSCNQEISKKFIGEDLKPFGELMKNTSLLLINSHFSLHEAMPLVPGVVEIGGVHLGEKKKIPQNIEKFINESTHGVIYFSLGSMIKGHTFPQEKREAFLRAFARLPQRVLWKWENETMPGKPDNVMIQKWMPQFDILSHPNVKAFISHGGLLGTTEAVHCGVPMVVMPQYGDQHTNAKAVEANGGGVILYLKDATEEKVYQSLKTILDPEFRAKAKALSERFRDRPMSPMDTAIYWVEYVARHKGAPHMKTAAVDMPLYQYLLLDVLAFLAVILLTFFYVSYRIVKFIFRSVFAKKKVKQN